MSELVRPTSLDAVSRLDIPEAVLSRLMSAIRARHPRKSFGYMLSDSLSGQPMDFVLFEENIRNDDLWRGGFESYGDYFVIHGDAGFVATSDEVWRVEKQMRRKGLYEVGLIHSHQRHPANFSRIDYDMHMARFDSLWHMIVSMRNPKTPVVRIFAPSRSGTREIPLHVVPRGEAAIPELSHEVPRSRVPSERAEVEARLALDASGFPACKDPALVLLAIAEVLRAGDPDLADTLLTRGFLRGAQARFDEFVAPVLAPIPAMSFLMGSRSLEPSNLCGEEPRHPVTLSPYRIATTPVTAGMYTVFDPGRRPLGKVEARLPLTGLSWPEAALFCMWVGARLPTEAEWELACAGGADGEWCCVSERELTRYAWYCTNSNGRAHPVGELEPNGWGVWDMHGNVWEWCLDTYDEGFYAKAPPLDPVNSPAWGYGDPSPTRDKVTRGGSFQSLPEMCRTRYRFHEPSCLRAADLGFRLACDGLVDGA